MPNTILLAPAPVFFVLALVFCPRDNSLAAPRLVVPSGVAPPHHCRYDLSARVARHDNPRADRASYLWDRTLGYGAGKLRIAKNPQVDDLNALVMDFALPASLFVAAASASRRQMFVQMVIAIAVLFPH